MPPAELSQRFARIMHTPKIVALPIQEQDIIRKVLRYTQNWSDLPQVLQTQLEDAEEDAELHPGAVYPVGNRALPLPPSQRGNQT
jgi:hypothetical protein